MGLLSKSIKIRMEQTISDIIIESFKRFFTLPDEDIPTIHIPPEELNSLFKMHLHYIALRDAELVVEKWRKELDENK